MVRKVRTDRDHPYLVDIDQNLESSPSLLKSIRTCYDVYTDEMIH